MIYAFSIRVPVSIVCIEAYSVEDAIEVLEYVTRYNKDNYMYIKENSIFTITPDSFADAINVALVTTIIPN